MQTETAAEYVPQPYETSLSKLAASDWAVLSNRWARGADWCVSKLGERHWQVSPAFGGFPLFRTKTAAFRACSDLVLAESRWRNAQARAAA